MPENEPLKSLPKGTQVLGVQRNQPIKSLPSGTEVTGITKVNTMIPHLQNYAPDLSGQNQLENTLNDIVKTSRRTISDSEKDILRDVLSNPNRTPEQAVEAIKVLQGYDAKFQNEQQKEGDRTYYYLKREDNGVLVPKALTYGERPPAGYDVASVWGNPDQAKGDAWYTDLGKSLYNGAVGAVQSVVELGQLGTIVATGEESDFLNSTINTAEQLKFTKDESLKTPIYNTEGINKWADLLDLDRFNFSKESLWGTMNMAAESVTEFMVGAKGAATAIKAINGAEKLTKAGISGSAFTASFLQNLGENIELAKENGLEGREIAAFALPVTAGQAAIDAKWGLQSTIYKNLFTKTEKQLLKDFAKQTLKTSTGELSEAGLKELIKGTVLAYDSKLATLGKDALISMTKEGLQEAGQDAVEKAGEELFDKLRGEEKFGTDAADPKSFGSYMQNFVTGFVAGAPLSFVAGQQRKSNERQSIDAFKIVEGGQDKMNEFKENVYAAQRNGDLTEQQRDQAIFKIDTYNKYWNQTKGLNMSKEERRKAFELAFSIEGLKNEIPANTEDLDPIDIAKVKNKEELIKSLQKDLNELLLKQEIIKEPVVGQDTINKVDKATKPKEGEEEKKATHEDLLKRFNALVAEETDELDLTEPDAPKRAKLEEVEVKDWNELTSLKRKQILQEHLKHTPGNEIEAQLQEGEYGTIIAVLPDGKKVLLSQSAESKEGKTRDFIKRENLPATKETGRVSGPQGEPYFSYKEPVGIKRVEIQAYDPKTGRALKNEDGSPKRKAVLSVYNKETGGHIVFTRELDKKGFTYKSSKYEPKEQTQLEAIRNANHLNEEIKPYSVGETKAPKPKKETQQRKDRIREFAGQIADGTLTFTPETSQFYDNNRKEIESELKKIQKGKKLNSTDQQILDEFEANTRPLSENEVQEQLEAEQARDRQFAQEGVFSIANSSQIGGYYDKNFIYGLNELIGAPNENVLNYIRNYTNDDIKEAIDVMARNTSKINNIVKFAGFTDKVRNNDTFLGIYEPKTGDIYLNSNIFTDFSSENLARVIAHEYIHAYTHSALHNKTKTQAEKEFNDNMNLLFDYFKQTSVFDKEYGLTNVDEFVAEITTNPEFVKKLIESKNRNIIQRFIDALLRLFGIERNPDRANNIKQAIEDVLTFIPESTPRLTNEDGYYASRFSIEQIRDIADKLETKPVDEIPYEELTALYNDIFTSEPFKGKSKIMKDIMTRIALNMKERGLEQDANIDRDVVANKDIKWIDKWFKVLSHFGDAFPELKEFSKLWNSAFFTKMKEARAEKNTHDKLALDVIKEKNKKMGLLDWSTTKLRQALSDQKFKYFDFLDNNGKMITVSEAQKKGLSKAQIDYIRYVRDLFAKRMNLIGDEYIQNMDMDVLRLDKKFAERFQTEGLISAVSGLFGSDNLLNTKILFKNPNTSKEEYVDFGTVEQALTKYGEKGLIQKGKALLQLFMYAVKARKQLKRDIESGKVKVPKRSEFTLDENGQLKSRFENTKVSRRDYSKDFYSAVNQYIDDTMHIKHISPLVPVINSIEYLNKTGVFDDEGSRTHQKPNVAEWAEKWTKLHILQRPDETAPALDKTLKFLRFMTSALTMWFNVPANVLNVAIGNYNTIRDQDGKTWAKGQGRLFGGKDRKFGVLNKYAYDIIQKYAAIMSDTDSNVGQTGSNIFIKLAYLGQNWGELQIQGSALLGLMNDKDYNSFEYRKNKYGVDELVVKDGVNEKELEERILANLDKVSDVQGKYGAKDKRNIMNNELGKVALMYRVWLPDAFRVRYGEKGSWTNQINGGFKEMRRQIADKGFMETMVSGKETQEVKDFKRNLKGLMATGLLISLVYATDDDDKKSGLAKMFNRALSDVLFVFDADNLKFTVEKPVAVAGPLIKLINVADHLFANEADDFYSRDNKYGDEGDSKLRSDIVGLTPKPVKAAIDEIVED